MADVASRWLTLPSGELAPEGEEYSFSFPPRDDGLGESIAQRGVLRPLIVLKTTAMKLVVGGRRRLALAAKLGISELPVRLVEKPEKKDLWDLLLDDALVGRELNPVEKGLYLTKRSASTGEDGETLAERVHPKIGIAPREEGARGFVWLATQSAKVKRGYADGDLPEKSLGALSRAPAEDARAVAELAANGRWGANKFSDFARCVFECAWRAGIPAAEYIAREGFEDHAAAPEILRRMAREHRYPKLFEHERDFGSDLRDLKLPKRVHFGHPQGFEGGTLKLDLTFSSLEELQDSLDELRTLSKKGGFECFGKYLK